MVGEFLNIETAQKVVRLEKENKQYEKIIDNFAKEINRLFDVIKYAYEQLEQENTEITKEDLKNILSVGLNKVKGVKNVKTTSQ